MINDKEFYMIGLGEEIIENKFIGFMKLLLMF